MGARSLAKTGCGLALASAAAFIPLMAQADDGTGFHGSLRAGPSLLQDLDFAEATTANLALNPNACFVVGGEVGYHVTNALRIEFDLGYARNDLSGAFQQNVRGFVPCSEIANNPCLAPRVDGDIASLSGFFGMGLLRSAGLGVSEALYRPWRRLRQSGSRCWRPRDDEQRHRQPFCDHRQLGHPHRLSRCCGHCLRSGDGRPHAWLYLYAQRPHARSRQRRAGEL